MAKSPFKKLFGPGQIGSVRIKNRMVKMGAQLSFTDWEDGYVPQRYINYYEALAKGGVGLVTVAGTEIAKEDLVEGFAFDDDKYLPRLRELTDAIHRHDCPAFVQLVHVGDWTSKPIASTALSREEYPMSLALPRAVTIPEIKEIVNEFGEQAARAKRAGFQGVEINAGCNHFLNTFLSPAWNKRQDEYGGNTENRGRIMSEIVQEVKRRNGQDFAVVCLYNVAEPGLTNGMTIEEAKGLAKYFEAAGADAIHARIEFYVVRKSRRFQSNLGYGMYDSTHFPYVALYPEVPSYAPPEAVDVKNHGAGAWVPAAVAIKKVVNIPVIAVGGISPEMGEKLLKAGKVDFVYINRRLMADHDLPHKLQEGKLDDIAPCTYCTTCIHQEEYHELYPNVTCRVNAALGKEKEYEIKPAAKQKKVVVIGGGPAGMEAARVAAIRGHKVTLFEKEMLGGSMNAAAIVKGIERENLLDLVDYLKRQINKLGVDVREGREATKEVVEALKPDVIIVAVGGKHHAPDIPGMDNRKVLTGEILFDQLKKYMKITGAKLMTKLVTRYVPVGKWVVIMGGGIHGCQTAEFLIKRGRKVTIVESGPKIGDGLLAHWLKPQLLDWLEKKDVVFLTDAKYEEVTDKGLTVSINGERQILEADTVITALPLVPNLGLVESLKGIAPEIYAIGDCNTPSYIANAVEDGSYLARQI